MATGRHASLRWFNNIVIYQVLVRSFQDSNGDGCGDLPGLINRLAYIRRLGADAILLNPITASTTPDPSCAHYKDQLTGYEVMDFFSVNPQYGTLDDFRCLVAQSHALGLRVVIDFPTIGFSPHHPFFLDAITNPVSQYRDWFMIRDRPAKGPWLNFKGAPWNKLGSFYYYALWFDFPFPNHKHEPVRQYFLDIADHWLRLGTDGFRLDAAKYTICNGPGVDLQENQSETIRYWGRFRHHIEKRYGEDIILLAEVIPMPRHIDYIGRDAHIMDFLFDGVFAEALYSGSSIDICSFTGLHFAGVFPTVTSKHSLVYHSNHDRGRIASKIIDCNTKKLKLLANLLLLANGTPVIYFGDEIGIQGLHPGVPVDDEINYLSTMAWSADAFGGFTSGNACSAPETRDFCTRNVEWQEGDIESLLTHYKRLIELRKRFTAFAQGARDVISCSNEKIFAYCLADAATALLIIHNLHDEIQSCIIDTQLYGFGLPLRVEFGEGNPSIRIDHDEHRLVCERICPQSSCVVRFSGHLLGQSLGYEPHPPRKSRLALVETGSPVAAGTNYSLRNQEAACALRLRQPADTRAEIRGYMQTALGPEITYIISGNLPSDLTVPLSAEISYFTIAIGGPANVVEFNWDAHLRLTTRVIVGHSENKYLRSLRYGRDQFFHYFCVERGEMLLKNSGIDLAVLFSDPFLDRPGTHVLEFWKLPSIRLSQPAHALLVFQDKCGDPKPILYTRLTKNMQPGVKRANDVCFRTQGSRLYIAILGDALPAASYNIAAIVWSAGGHWLDSPPRRWPVVEALPPVTATLPDNNYDLVTHFSSLPTSPG